MRDGLIELGEITRAPEVPVTAARPEVPYRVLLGVLSLVLVALLGGGLHRKPQEPPTVIPARLADGVLLDGSRMFVVSAGRPLPGTDRVNEVISTYALPEVRLIARNTVTVPGSVVFVQQVGNTLLVTYQAQTNGLTALAAFTPGADRPLWRRTAQVIGASAAEQLVVLATNDAALGVDLVSGAVRWSVPRPADGYIGGAGEVNGFPRWLVTVTDSGRLETRDARTGRAIAATTIPRAVGRSTGLLWPINDLALVDLGGSGFAAFRLPGLAPLWRTATQQSNSWTQADCGPVVCVSRQQRGMIALDPATGRELWRSDRWVFAESAGPYLLAITDSREQQPPLWVLDPLTGRPLGDFGVWQQVASYGGTGPVYGIWQVPGEYKIYYGILDPATRAVRILGSGQRVSTGCEVGAGVLVCRLIDASIAVWRLR